MKKITLVLLPLLLLSTAQAANWNSDNDPANMSQHYDYFFDHLPLNGAVFPMHTPWSDNYWESDWGGISLRWNTLTVQERDPDLFDYQNVDKYSLFQYTPPTLAQLKSMSRNDLLNLSPAEKYDILMGRYDYPTVKSERQRTDPSMNDWQGICHGWVPAALNEIEPKPMDMTNADGIVIPFGSSDTKGLLSYYYGVTAYNYARGSRELVRNTDHFQFLDQVDGFEPLKWLDLAANALIWNNGVETAPADMNDSSQCADPAVWAKYGSLEKCIDQFVFFGNVDSFNVVGQVGARDKKSDPNAGAFFVVMANQLGIQHEAFAANLNRSRQSDQIWNQPISSYTTTTDYDHRGKNGRKIGLTTTLTFVSEIPQTYNAVLGTPIQRFETEVFSYEVETDAVGNVIDGSWKHGTHPNFIWKHSKLPIQGYFSRLRDLDPGSY